MKYGLLDDQLELIEKALGSHPEIETAVLYGSRAINTFKEASDVDIALKGEKVNKDLAINLKIYFEEETDLPYFFDCLSYHDLDNKKLKEQIDKYGVVIYRKAWKKVKLGDVVFINPTERILKGSVSKKILMDNLTPFKRKISNYTESIYKGGSKFRNGDTLVARITPCLENGKTAFVDILEKNEISFGSTEFIVLRNKPEQTDKYFVFYFSTSKYFRHPAIQSMTGSSGRQRVQENKVKDIEFLLPPLPEQKAIAEVLSSLDDKIELLHKQNKTLEDLAQTLFRKWFIEDAQPNWEKGFISNEFNLIMGLSPPGTSYNIKKEGLPMFQGNADFGFRFPQNRVYTTNPKRVVKPLSTLISVRAPVGEQNMALEKCCIGRGIAGFNYKKNEDFYTYTYYKIKSLINEIKQFNEVGTVFGSINKKDFNTFPIIIPPMDVVQKFQNKVKPIDDKIISNFFQVKLLEKLRDTLLLKLMAGQVKVKY